MDDFGFGVFVVFMIVGLIAWRVQQAARKAAENEHVRKWGKELAENPEIKGAATGVVAGLIKRLLK